MTASHLLKATHWWTDLGLGKYELFYLRDKEKREVDFLVVKNSKPWLMVEVKSSANQPVSPHLKYFYQQFKSIMGSSCLRLALSRGRLFFITSTIDCASANVVISISLAAPIKETFRVITCLLDSSI